MAASKQIFNDLNLVLRLNQHIEDIVHSDEATAALLGKQTSFKVLAELDAVQNPDPREDAQFEHQRARTVDDAAAAALGSANNALVSSELPFHLQGDQDFDRASAVAERRALRRSDAIRHKVHFLWDVARGQRTVEVPRIASIDKQRALGRVDTAAASTVNTIDERDYAAMMLLIYKVLRDDFVVELAQLQVHCDWEVDSQRSATLGFDAFFAALFELVDLWTCDIGESTYVRFLELLTRRITLRVVIFLDDAKLQLALSDNFDDAVVVKAIPLHTIARFASVAKIVECQGVRTIGDLATADPHMVERERRAYLARNHISPDKIGAKLQDLLDTFNGLSEQLLGGDDSSGFAATQYSLENMKLVRHPIAVHDADPSRTSSNTAVGTAAVTSAYDTSTSSSGVFVSRSSLVSPADSNSNSTGSGRPRRPSRRLSIHDLSQAESGVINALRSAFILEKHIAIVRQSDSDSIRAELAKFGVDADALADADAIDRYNALYELFVLRDGESIKELAQTLLAQIKLELAAHGVTVDDEDAEVTYDGFYGAVVATTGDAIVKDAQLWVAETVSTNTVAAYLKADYHELKPLDQVTLIGMQPGDDEFKALLSIDDNDDDGDDDGDDDTQDGAATDAAKPTESSMIQRKPSERRHQQHAPPRIKTSRRSEARPNAERRSLKSDRPAESIAQSSSSSPVSTASPRRRSGPRADTHAGDASTATSHKRKTSNDRDDTRHSSNARHRPASVSQRGDPQRRRSSASEHQEPSTLSVATAADTVAQAASESDAEDASASKHKDSSDDAHSVIHASAHRASDDDNDANARRHQSVALKTSRSKAELTVSIPLCDLDARDTANDDVDREAQGIDFGYEDESTPVLEPEPVLHESIAELVPKVPKIVIGPSGAAGANIPVAARYIQLLGLGTVLTASDEAGLYDLLRSDEGRDADLVCFDVGNELGTAGEKLTALQHVVGRCVIAIGGDVESADRTRAAADDCVARGAIYFAALPINFPALRAEILAFFESSTQPFILRQRKATAAGAFRMATRSIGAAGMFGVPDAARKPSTPLAYANIAKSSPRSPRLSNVPPRKSTHSSAPLAAVPTMLPPVVKDAASLIHFKALDDVRATEAASALVPSSPRSLKSFKKASPRLSVVLKKMMR